MPSPPISSLDALGQTLALPLWGRAAWARHRGAPDALAERLVAELGVDTASMEGTLGAWGWLAFGQRAAWVDERVGAWLAGHPDGWVVNVGAGLDPLLQRVDNGRCRGLSLDRPNVLDVRARLLPPHPRERVVAVTLPDAAAFAGLDGPAVFVLAGLSMYLPEAVLHAVLADIGAAAAPGSLVLLDVYSPIAASLTQLLIRGTGVTEAPVHRHGGDPGRLTRALGRPCRLEVRDLHDGVRLGGLGLKATALAALARAVRFTQLIALNLD